jgi:small subunit ribosomal protein S15
MAVYLTKEKRAEIFAEYGKSEQDSGATEAQVALFTYRIKHLSEHLRENRKDHAARKALLSLVGKRKRLLDYLSREDLDKYRKLIEKLGIRK